MKRTRESGLGMREAVRISEPTTERFDLEAGRVDLNMFRISSLEHPKSATPGLMETGKAREVLERYRDRRDFVHQQFGGRLVEIPYTLLLADKQGTFGDFSSSDGQNAFADADVVIEDDENELPSWAVDLHRFAELKLARKFSLDEELTALRELERHEGKIRFTVGMSRYSQAFYSMGSEGVRLELTQAEHQALEQKSVSNEHLAELESLLSRLQATHGIGKSIRDVIFQKVGDLPEYNRRVHHYLLGVAGTALTQDGEMIFVNRGAGVSVNRGINVTASGAVKFQKDFLAQHGIQRHLAQQMHEEAKEEIGLKSGDLLLGAMQERIALELGVEQGEYELVPVGMARELPRGGSPEMMFLIRFKGKTSDLIERIANNPHEDRSEIDTSVFALPAEKIFELLKRKDAERVVQHKGLLNLMMIDRYLCATRS